VSVARTVVMGCGAYLPEQIVTNDELAKRVDTSNEWIIERTGIERRHIARDDEMTSDLALKAAQRALDASPLEANDIDLIVLATATPDQTFPATAATVQAELGITRGAAFDIQAVCSGFVYGMSVADNFIRCGQAQNVLLIGAETFSRILDWEDRGTCVLFGDGAGALVLSRADGEGTSVDRGVLTTHIHSDGRKRDLLYVDGGPSSTQTTGYLRMIGKEVFRHAVVNISSVIEEAVEAAGVTIADIDWFVPHQANKRILVATARRLGIPEEKVITTIQDHANTSAASVPLALDRALSDGRIQKNDLVLLEAMGGGFTWGAALIRW